MGYENKAFVPQSPAQLKKEYMETPFWFSMFGPGSQITIVEDLPRNKPMRFYMKPDTKRGGPAYASNLIKITDGFSEKDLDLSKTSAQRLFLNLPDNIQNLKGCTFANDNGRWIFVAQTDTSLNSGFPQPTRAPEHEQSTLDLRIRALKEAMSLTASLGTKIDSKIMIVLAERFEPGNALGLIGSAKNSGQIMEKEGTFYTV